MQESKNRIKINNLIDSTKKSIEFGKLQAEIAIKYKVDKNCHKCYGRGFVGFSVLSGKAIICKCAKRRKPNDNEN